MSLQIHQQILHCLIKYDIISFASNNCYGSFLKESILIAYDTDANKNDEKVKNLSKKNSN
jgi:hypothetical protein